MIFSADSAANPHVLMFFSSKGMHCVKLLKGNEEPTASWTTIIRNHVGGRFREVGDREYLLDRTQ